MAAKKLKTFLDNPILNKTGLACEIWKEDKIKPDNLRRRLEEKWNSQTLTPQEKDRAILAIEKFYMEARDAL
jgi:hypothetical protein